MGIEKNQIIRCEGIKKSFTSNQKGGNVVQVLNGTDLAVEKGSFISIMGASGSGKSTLLHLLGGLDRPDKGTVYWNDKDIFTLKRNELAILRGKTVGFVFQFHHLLNEFTALENVMLPMLIQGVRFSKAKQEALLLLQRFSVDSKKDNKPAELSGGEQQRIAMARALINKPDILLADEPTGNLDTANSDQLYDLLTDLNTQHGLTVIIVTHDLDIANKCRVKYRLANGQLAAL